MIPPLRNDGYLPVGLHSAAPEEVLSRFGSSTPRRRYLTLRLTQWLDYSRAVGAIRFFVDGSFVTGKADPDDVDAVVWLPADFTSRVHTEVPEALELYAMLTTRRPEEIFAAGSQSEWDGWMEFFSQTREPDGRRKGLVEVLL